VVATFETASTYVFAGRLIRNVEVRGSTPLCSTNKINSIFDPREEASNHYFNEIRTIFLSLDLLRKPIQILFNTFCIDARRVTLENVSKICSQLFRTLFVHRKVSSVQKKAEAGFDRRISHANPSSRTGSETNNSTGFDSIRIFVCGESRTAFR
jgi:hypothetical protein